MLVNNGQINGFKQNRMVAVILVHMLSHLDLLEDTLNQSIDLAQ